LILQIDLETYSSIDLKTCGVHRYVEAPDFEILLFAYAFDDEPVEVIDLTAFEEVPDRVMASLTDPSITKAAFNAAFERTAIAKHFGIRCDPLQWRCTSVWALALGLPGNLEGAAEVLKLDAKKDARGKALIKYFSVPCKPTKTNGERTRNMPHHDPEKWQQYIGYNRQDVIVERELRKKLERFPVPTHEWRLWALDQRINDRGIRLDMELVERAIELDAQYEERLVAEAKEITGLDNPNSLTQLKEWLAERGLETPDGMGKDQMLALLDAAPDEDVRRVLELRQEMSKTSVDKYYAMKRSVCDDGRARGLLQFCGANRTWRWAGRLIQVQNLTKNEVDDIAEARELLRSGDFELLELLYGAPPFMLSQLIRTAFIPSEGCRFIVSDFSAIEARVIAWLADEEWVLEVFRTHGKIYEATASQMFGIPLDTIVRGHVNYRYRASGKVATLACGFQGGPNAMANMDKKKEVDAAEYPRLVKQWREANPNIVQLWFDAEKAAIKAVKERTSVPVKHGVAYRYEAGVLFADLPSGRSLAYVSPSVSVERIVPKDKDKEPFEKECLSFWGMDQIKKKWEKQRTYGGRLVENLVQAIARDCLAESLIRLDDEGYVTAMHVHDEAVLDVPIGTGSVEHVAAVMGREIPWARGLPLAAAGFECEFYQKD